MLASVRIDGADFQEAAIGLHHADEICRQPEGGIPPHEVLRVENLVLQRMRPRRRQRSSHQYAVRRADLGDAGDMQELLPAGLLEPAPQFIGAPQQRHVGRVLEIAEPDEAGDAMRGAAVVAGRKRSMPSTRRPRRASAQSAALPITPRPMTTTSCAAIAPP